MTDNIENERKYKRAVEVLSSSLSNRERVEESLKLLEELGEYKDSRELLEKYKERYTKLYEEADALTKKRRVSVVIQKILTVVGLAIALALILIIVYALRPHL